MLNAYTHLTFLVALRKEIMMQTIRMTLSSLVILRLFLIVSIFPTAALAQANFTAQVRGVVQDSTLLSRAQR